jgi:capsular exopolysaccharide synthesis family protein
MAKSTLDASFPALPAPGNAQVPSPYYWAQLPPAPPEPESDERAVPLSHYWWVIRRYAWRIFGFVLAAMLVTYLISSRLQPVYEATATIDVDRAAPSAILGDQSRAPASTADAAQFLLTQVRLIQSDAVLRPVAARYQLLALELGAEKAKDESVRQAPVSLKNLKVTQPSQTFLLYISYRSPDAQLSAKVANDIAKSYLDHNYTIRIRSSANMTSFMEQELEGLRAKMEGSGEKLAQFERELNMINPEEKTSILTARLQQLNTEYTAAQADRVRREAVYQSARGGSLEAAQVSGQGEALAKLQERLNESRQKFADIRATWGANSPEHRKAASVVLELQRQIEESRANILRRVQVEFQQAVNREKMLSAAVTDTKREFDRLNSRSFQYQQVKREADADKRLYEELQRKIKEGGINAGFQNSNNVRIADWARPPARPVLPNVRLNLLLAFLFSSLIACGAAVLSDLLDTTVRDPEQASRVLNTDVVGTLPAVREVRPVLSLPKPDGASSALVKPDEVDGYKQISNYDEAIRTLRNSILLGDFDRRIRSLLVTSASPGEGKTTTAVHLAVAHSQQGKKTLLIDADLRRPSVHKKLGIASTRGLSNILTGELAWRDARLSFEERPDFDVILAGPPSRRASDLVGSRMVELLEDAASSYDLIIVDSPPLLGFAEPLQMATATDGVVVITRAGQTSRKAIGSVINTLSRLRANVIGVVLNQVKKGMSDTYYYYGYYRKYYTAETSES